MQHRTKGVWIDGFSSGVWMWECFRTVECLQVEFQVDGAATEKARWVSSVCMRGTTSVGRAQSLRCMKMLSVHSTLVNLLFGIAHTAATGKQTTISDFSKTLPILKMYSVPHPLFFKICPDIHNFRDCFLHFQIWTVVIHCCCCDYHNNVR